MPIPEKNHDQKIQAALYRISEAAQASQDLGELYKLIHDAIAELMPAENFYIALYDAAVNLLSFPYYADEFDETPTPQLPGKGLTEYVLRSGLPLLATPEIYQQLVENGDVELIGADSLDWLGVPLKTPARTVGMMAVQTYNPQVRYSQADQDILVFISNQVAMAIERKRMDASLRANEQRYRMLFEQAPVGILLVTPLGWIVDVNHAALHILGSPSAEATKAINVLTFPPLIAAGISADIQRCIETAQEMMFEHSYTSKWGKSSFIQFFLTPILDEVGRISLVQLMMEDISQRKQAETQIRKLNRMLQVISQANETLVRVTDEGELMQQVCQILVDVGGYRLAWIGLAGTDLDRAVTPMAVAGFDEGYVAGLTIPRLGSESDNDPGGTAPRSDQPLLVQDIASDPLFAPWREDALSRGYASVIFLPLISHGQTLGVIVVYAAQPHAFDGEEIKLLSEMAGDLTYGILALREQATRQQMEAVLRDSEEKYRNVVERANDGITIIQDGRVIFANQRLMELWGGTIDEVIGTPFVNYISVSTRQELSKNYRLRMSGKEIPSTYETQLKRRDGSQVDAEVNAGIFSYQGRPADLVIIRDITERKRAAEALRLSEEKFATTFRTSPDAISINRKSDGMYLEINDGFTAITGYSSEDVKGKSSDDLLIWADPADDARLEALLDQYGKVNNLEASFRMKDGQIRIGLMSARLIQIENETCILSITRDITELKRAERERAQRLAELEAVNQLSTALRASQNLGEMLPRLLEETLRLMHAQAGAIWLYDPVSGELHAQAARGWYEQLSETPLKPGEGIGGRVFASGQPITSDEIAADPRSRPSIRTQIPRGWSGVCVPIRTAAETIGVFYVAAPVPRTFTTEEMRLLTTLVEIAGNALHRMKLHAETELHVQRLSALRTIDMTITASLDLRVTLDVLLEQVVTQLEADAADVLLLNEHTQNLEYIAGRGFHSSSPARARQRLGEAYAGRVALERRLISISHPDLLKNAPAQAYLLDGEGFGTYHGVPLIAKGKVKGVLEIFHRMVYKPDLEWLDFLETLSGQAAIAIDDAQLFNFLQRVNTELMVAYDSTIEGWSRALELRDQETEGHTRRVAEMTMELARGMHVFSEENLVHIRRGALLHDIGKMGVPDQILLKPSPLTEDEWVIMRKHPQYAYDLLSPITYLRPALDIPYYHHEWWDGSGYPHGLAGEQIPLGARIFALVDVWDALTTDRPYGKAWNPEVVREYIRAHSGTQFDPQVVAVFLRLLDAGTFQTSISSPAPYPETGAALSLFPPEEGDAVEQR
jgi:PAS domain S-box-containing protein